MNKCLLGIGIAALLVSGCSSKKIDYEKKVASSVAAGNGSQVNIETWYDLKVGGAKPTDEHLRLIQRSDTASAVAISTLYVASTLLLGGSAQAGSFTKEDLQGTSIKTLPNPTTSWLMPRITEVIADGLKNSPAQTYLNPITIKPKKWYLVYKNLSETGGLYELHYTAWIDKDAEASKKSSGATYCSQEEGKETVATLEQWQANDYQKVKEATQHYMETCLAELQGKRDQYLGHETAAAAPSPASAG